MTRTNLTEMMIAMMTILNSTDKRERQTDRKRQTLQDVVRTSGSLLILVTPSKKNGCRAEDPNK